MIKYIFHVTFLLLIPTFSIAKISNKYYYYGYDLATSFSFADLLAPFNPRTYGLYSVNSSGRITGLSPVTETPAGVG